MVDVLFHGSAISVLPFWAAMILFPRSRWTAKMVATPFIILPAVLCYVALGVTHGGAAVGVFEQPSAASLAQVMAEPWAAAAFWAYAGAFDLFVGRWMFLDAQTRGVPHLVLAPALVVAIFFGPVGFLIYAALIATRRWPARPTPG